MEFIYSVQVVIDILSVIGYMFLSFDRCKSSFDRYFCHLTDGFCHRIYVSVLGYMFLPFDICFRHRIYISVCPNRIYVLVFGYIYSVTGYMFLQFDVFCHRCQNWWRPLQVH